MPANLAVNCQKIQPLSKGTGDVVYRWMYDATEVSTECYFLHKATLDFYDKLRETNAK